MPLLTRYLAESSQEENTLLNAGSPAQNDGLLSSTSSAPTGPAGGALTGEYPSPDLRDEAIELAHLSEGLKARLIIPRFRAVITTDLEGALTGAISSANSDGVVLTNGAHVVYPIDSSDAMLAGLYIYNTTGAWTRTDDVILAGGEFDVEIGGALFGGARLYCRNITDPVPGVDTILFAVRRAIPIGAAGGSLAGSYPNPSIAANAVTAVEIAANAVGASELAAGAVTADELAPNAVTTGAMLDAAITAPKLEAGVRRRLTGPFVRAVVANNLAGNLACPIASANSDDVTLGENEIFLLTQQVGYETTHGYYVHHMTGTAERTDDIVTAGQIFEVADGGTYYGGRLMCCKNITDPVVDVDPITFGFPIAECLTDNVTIANINSIHSQIERSAVQLIDVYVDGALTGTRPAINFISGSGITFTGTDNPTDDRVDIALS